LLPNSVAHKAGQHKREMMLHPATSCNNQLQQATMSSNIRLQKTCQYCGERFTAKTTVTQFCSDDCAKRAYKKRKRDEKVEAAIKQETEKALYNPAIAQKEFLTVEEACQLINASRWIIYRLIEKGELKAGKLGEVHVFPGQLSMNYSN
jgi:excisionase family DNA binding protein